MGKLLTRRALTTVEFFTAELRTEEEGILGLRECSSEIEPIAQLLRCGMW